MWSLARQSNNFGLFWQDWTQFNVAFLAGSRQWNIGWPLNIAPKNIQVAIVNRWRRRGQCHRRTAGFPLPNLVNLPLSSTFRIQSGYDLDILLVVVDWLRLKITQWANTQRNSVQVIQHGKTTTKRKVEIPLWSTRWCVQISSRLDYIRLRFVWWHSASIFHERILFLEQRGSTQQQHGIEYESFGYL